MLLVSIKPKKRRSQEVEVIRAACRKGWDEVSAAYREGEMLSLAEHLRGRAAVFS